MKKVVRLTEEDLVRIVKKVIAEQGVEGPGDPKRNEGPGDIVTYERNIFNMDLFPSLIKNGFRKVVDPNDRYGKPCSKTPKKGEVLPVCCTYLYKGTHETGVNVMIDCGKDGFNRNIVVYNKGGQNKKSFDVNNWKQSLSYALSLK